MSIKLSLLTLSMLAATSVAAFATPAIVNHNVNVRSGPGLEYRVIGQAWQGTSVDVTYCDDDEEWCLVNQSGWVRATYLTTGWGEGPFSEYHPEDANDLDAPTYWVNPSRRVTPYFAAPSLHRAMPMFDHRDCVSSGVAAMCL
ncbi:SH3 domain-containing protein [Devosia sp.]|uniref:SH3 domain-containing protein n=1 Tax=Devosia sp. TaxID=1871048 RepID=UPI003263777C